MNGLLADINSTGCCIWLALLSQERLTVLFWRMCSVVVANLKIPPGYRNRMFKWNDHHVRDRKLCKMLCLQITLNPEAVSIQKNFGFLFLFHILQTDKSRSPAGWFLTEQTKPDCILVWYFSSTVQIVVSKILAWILELFQMWWCDNKEKNPP